MITYTDKEVYDIGYHHGSDGIVYFPPSRWGTQQWLTAPDAIYHKGYEEGRHYRRHRNQTHTSDAAGE